MSHHPTRRYEFARDLTAIEAHLNARRIPSWKIALYGFVIAGLLAGHLSYAACGKVFEKTHYSAIFKVDAQDYRFMIGSEARGGAVSGVLVKANGRFPSGVGGECQAVCEPQTFEKASENEPIAFQLECHSAKFSAFSSPTTLIWGATRGKMAGKAPALRFGTWLNGYRSFPLLVETDQYYMPKPAPTSFAAK